MSVTEDIARLIVEADQRGFTETDAKIKSLERELGQLNADYRAGSVAIEDYFQKGQRLGSELDNLRAGYAGAEAAVKRYGSAQAAAAAMSQQAAQTHRNYGQAAMAASFALQDFTSANGGFLQQIASVQNNLPTIIAQLGGSAGLAAGFSAVAVIAAAAGPHIYNFAKSVGSVGDVTKTATVSLAGMTEQLSKAKDRMEELGKKTSATLSELAEYNTLRANTAILEKKIADEQERQQRAKEFQGLKKPEQTEAEKQRAEILKPQFGDPGNEAIKKAVALALPRDTKKAIEAEYNEALEKERQGLELGAFLPAPVRKTLRDNAEKLRLKIQAEEERLLKEAGDLVADAIVGGQEGAFNRVRELMESRPQFFTDKQREAFEAASPEGQLQANKIKEQLEQAEKERDKPEPKAKPEGPAIVARAVPGGFGGAGRGGGGAAPGGGPRAPAPAAGGDIGDIAIGALPRVGGPGAPAALEGADGGRVDIPTLAEGGPSAAGPASIADRMGVGKQRKASGKAAAERRAKIEANKIRNRAAVERRQRGVRTAQAKAARLRDAMRQARGMRVGPGGALVDPNEQREDAFNEQYHPSAAGPAFKRTPQFPWQKPLTIPELPALGKMIDQRIIDRPERTAPQALALDNQFVGLAQQGNQLQGRAINAIGGLAGTVNAIRAEQARLSDMLNQIVKSFGGGTQMNFRNR